MPFCLISHCDPLCWCKESKTPDALCACYLSSVSFASPKNFQASIQNQHPQPGPSCHRTKCWLVFSSLLMLAYHLPAQPTPISFPSSQACWNLNFKWTPSMATIDKKGAFDCSCIAEKKGGDSSWLRPSRNSSSTAPLPLRRDALACSYSFKLPASMFPIQRGWILQVSPVKDLNVDPMNEGQHQAWKAAKRFCNTQHFGVHSILIDI